MKEVKSKLLPIKDINIRVGLLGGSFNPAHSGHLHISLEAVRLLNLDYVIWLVSPQNPLKADMRNSLDRRVNYAKLIAKHEKKIIVSNVEKLFPTTYTAETIKILQHTYSNVKFVWMMGADNMAQIHKWYNWRQIFETVFVAVFDREEYEKEALESKAGRCYRTKEINSNDFIKDNLDKGSWFFFKICKSPMSSTALRDIYQVQYANKNLVGMQSVDYLKDVILTSLDQDQADNIVVCNLKGKADFASYMVIASGRSNRHVISMIEGLMERLKEINISSIASGLEDANWVLLDVGDVIVSAFMPEYRELYKLEQLWEQ